MSPDQTTTGERLVDIAEVAAMLGKRPKTLMSWRSAGNGPRSYRIGGSVMYRPSDVESWIEEQEPRGAAGRLRPSPTQRVTLRDVVVILRQRATDLSEIDDEAAAQDWLEAQPLFMELCNLANRDVGNSGLADVRPDGTALVQGLPAGWTYVLVADSGEPGAFRLLPAVEPADCADDDSGDQ